MAQLLYWLVFEKNYTKNCAKMKIVLLLGTLAVFSVVSTTQITPSTHHHISKHIAAESAHQKKDEVQNSHKHLKKSGKKSHHDHEVANKGHSDVEHHAIDDKEAGGKKTKSHTQNAHQSSKHSNEHSQHGAKFEDGSKHKKTGFAKGFREQYHKDEHKKHDTFYSNGHKSGDYHVFGVKNAKHHNQKADKKSNGKYLSLKSGNKYGKSGKKATGHKIVDDKGYSHDAGHKNSYSKQDKWSKKGQQKAHNIQKYKYYPTQK